MILNLERFVKEERPYWEELERSLVSLRLPRGLAEAQRFFYLYRRAASGLVKLNTLAAGPEAREYLETLVGRAYADIHAAQNAPTQFRPLRWFFWEFPRAVRAHHGALWVSIAITLAGALAGSVLMEMDRTEAKAIIMPFEHLQDSPTERVQREEEEAARSKSFGGESVFAATLMQNNIRVSFLAAALGLTYAIGTVTLLFYNGAMVGAVAADYIRDGQGVFLLEWLLPHGSIEIPSILLAGQAGLMIGRALLGYDGAATLRERMRLVAPRLGYILFGVAVLLVWAGIMEAYLSQDHGASIRVAKIVFGTVELIALIAFLALAGRGGDDAGALEGEE